MEHPKYVTVMYLHTSVDGQPTPKTSPPGREQPSRTPLKRLRSSCVVVRVDDLDIHQVTDSGSL